MKRIDLHIHTTASDGTASPSEVVQLAKEAGLSAIAVTDHDTCSGCAEAIAAGRHSGLEVIPGIELSTRYGVTIHILGYCMRPETRNFAAALDWIVQERDERNRKMCSLMAADGIHADYDVMKVKYGEVIGRPNFGQMLVEQGYAESVQDAFNRFIEKGQKYYVSRQMLSIERCVSVIREAGGVPVIAHPFQYRMDDGRLRQLIEHCMDNGLQGLECRYTGYSQEQSDYLLQLAAEYHLLPTGGSDYHGTNKPRIALGFGDGDLKVPYEYLAAVQELARRNKL